MNDLDTLYPKWTAAIEALPYGVAKAFHDVFTLAADGKTHLVYGSDYSGKYPCLVNTVGVMLKATGGQGGSGLPTKHFAEVVNLFDSINYALAHAEVNTESGMVSPLAADIFLHHFPDFDVMEEKRAALKNHPDAPYFEASDDELAKEIAGLFENGDPCEITIADDVHLDVLLNSNLVPENVVLGNFTRPQD
jgi:hypothetical protein